MRSKISIAFEKCKKEKRTALITYTVAGDNTKQNSLKILNAIAKHADILELGFPQYSNSWWGANSREFSSSFKKRIKLKDVFQIVKKI